MHKTYTLGLLLLEVRRQIPKITSDDHYYQSVAAMTRKLSLKVPFHVLIRCIDFKGIDETNSPHLRFETRQTLTQCLINETSYYGIRTLPHHLVSFTKPITAAQTLPPY